MPLLPYVLLAATTLVPLLAACDSRAPAEITLDASAAAAIASAASLPPPPAKAATNDAETWNAAAIDWQPYDAGLATAKRSHKPICLVFYTTWCPHCRNYSHVFDDPRIVEDARAFVMIHLDADAEETIAAKYRVDGGYIPRTFFLAPDGTLDPSIHAPRPRSMYFYDERDPTSLLAGMSAALQRLAR